MHQNIDNGSYDTDICPYTEKHLRYLHVSSCFGGTVTLSRTSRTNGKTATIRILTTHGWRARRSGKEKDMRRTLNKAEGHVKPRRFESGTMSSSGGNG